MNRVIDVVGFWFLRWLSGWGELLNGVCIIITLGMWCPSISLITESWFLNWCETMAPMAGDKDEL